MDKRFIEDSAFLSEELEMAREERVGEYGISVIAPVPRNEIFDETCRDFFGCIISY